MGKPTGFKEFARDVGSNRLPELRILDYKEFHEHQPEEKLKEQGARCNLAMVELEKLEDPLDVAEVKELIEQHKQYTGSTVAEAILKNWQTARTKFHKVMPIEYRRALAQLAGATKDAKDARH